MVEKKLRKCSICHQQHIWHRHKDVVIRLVRKSDGGTTDFQWVTYCPQADEYVFDKEEEVRPFE